MMSILQRARAERSRIERRVGQYMECVVLPILKIGEIHMECVVLPILKIGEIQGFLW